MANEPKIVITGNLGKDPEIRVTQTGKNVVNFPVAVTPSSKVNGEWKDGDTIWFRCVAWEEMASSIATAYKQGDKVRVEGRLSESFFTDKEGNERKSLEISVDWIGQAPPKIATMKALNPDIIHRSDEEPAWDDFPF